MKAVTELINAQDHLWYKIIYYALYMYNYNLVPNKMLLLLKTFKASFKFSFGKSKIVCETIVYANATPKWNACRKRLLIEFGSSEFQFCVSFWCLYCICFCYFNMVYQQNLYENLYHLIVINKSTDNYILKNTCNNILLELCFGNWLKLFPSNLS